MEALESYRAIELLCLFYFCGMTEVQNQARNSYLTVNRFFLHSFPLRWSRTLLRTPQVAVYQKSKLSLLVLL